MIAELGHFALILSLCLALAQAFYSLVGAARGDAVWMAVARPAAYGQFLFMATAFGCLVYAFINNDFSVSYVAQNSNSHLPLQYRISAVWGAHEGSLLLWAAMLSAWGVAVALFSRSLPPEFVSRVLGVMALVGTGFMLFMLLTSNPFDRSFPVPMDGSDLNPLLQDPGLIIHPPLLYMGYVGLSVAFSFAIAALLGGRLDAAWSRWSRPWTQVAWLFLTLGIMLGSWWAYYELGWGGWWFWDPVENASFMPWLVATALIHSLAVTEKRGTFKNWTVLLAIFAFSLSLLGTFLVRSGVLTSVHAFATDPERGVFILAFLAVVIGGSLLLYALRAPQVKSSGQFELLSRETLLLINNVLLVVTAGSILLGTLYPLILDALGLGKISVGPPYFNSIFVPLMAGLAFALGIGPLVRWKQHKAAELMRRLIPSAVLALVVFVLSLVFDANAPLVALGLSLTTWILIGIVQELRQASRNRGLLSLSRSQWGMTTAHLGVVVFIVGMTLVSNYSINRDLRMLPGETVSLAGYDFRFESVKQHQGPNYVSFRGEMNISRNGKPVAVLHPEKRNYTVRGMPMTESGIDGGLFRDLYVALGEQLDGGAWAVRIYHKPFVRWLWLGAIIMALGGLLAASDKRYRISKRQLEQQTKEAPAAVEAKA